MEQEALGKNIAALEALLYLHGEPITFEKIASVLGISLEEASVLAAEFNNRLAREDRGLTLLIHEKKIQLVTKPDFSKILEDFVKDELREELTPASLETLSIVAYFGPISKGRIEYLRGVNSSFILRSLMLRGLVERTPDLSIPNGFLYSTSFDLMKHIGIAKKEELPEYAKFQTLLAAFEAAPAEPSPPEPQADGAKNP